MRLPSVKRLSLFGFLVCVATLLIAVYLQIHLGLTPCMLCVIQRYVLVLLAVCFLFGALYVPRRLARRIYYAGVLVISLFGVAVASRQVWLQKLAAAGKQVPSCGADLDYVLTHAPILDALKLIMNGSEDCSKVQLRVFTLSIPEWTAIIFAVLALLCLIQMIRQTRM